MATLGSTPVKSGGAQPAERMETKKVHGMQTVCKGAPVREEVDGKYKYGDTWGKLRKLIRRTHPKTGEAMQEHCNQDGSLWGIEALCQSQTSRNT